MMVITITPVAFWICIGLLCIDFFLKITEIILIKKRTRQIKEKNKILNKATALMVNKVKQEIKS